MVDTAVGEAAKVKATTSEGANTDKNKQQAQETAAGVKTAEVEGAAAAEVKGAAEATGTGAATAEGEKGEATGAAGVKGEAEATGTGAATAEGVKVAEGTGAGVKAAEATGTGAATEEGEKGAAATEEGEKGAAATEEGEKEAAATEEGAKPIKNQQNKQLDDTEKAVIALKKTIDKRKKKCEASIKSPPGGWGRDSEAKMAAMAKQVLISAGPDNDYGFDIHPSNRYSPYKCIDCDTMDGELKQLQCAKTKYMSKIGMKSHQNLRKGRYRSTISRICKANKKLACSKNALPVHDICNCDRGGMKLTEIFPYALSFYRELGEIIEGQTMSKADFEETLKKAKDKISKASDYIEARKDKIKKAAKFIGKGLLSDVKTLTKPATAIAKPILKDVAKGVGAVTGITGELKSAKKSYDKGGKLNKTKAALRVVGAPITGIVKKTIKGVGTVGATTYRGFESSRKTFKKEGKLNKIKGVLKGAISPITGIAASLTKQDAIKAFQKIKDTETFKAAKDAPGNIKKIRRGAAETLKNVVEKAADAYNAGKGRSEEKARRAVDRANVNLGLAVAGVKKIVGTKKPEPDNVIKAGQAALVGKEKLSQEEKQVIAEKAQKQYREIAETAKKTVKGNIQREADETRKAYRTRKKEAIEKEITAQQKKLQRAQNQTPANNRQAENFKAIFGDS